MYYYNNLYHNSKKDILFLTFYIDHVCQINYYLFLKINIINRMI